jgi:hypothetical protein
MTLSSPLKFTLALGCMSIVAPLSISYAAEPVTPPVAATSSRALPLTHRFEKVAGAENGPYVLKLKNSSKQNLEVEAKILLSVGIHVDTKTRLIPVHAIKPSETWSIRDLAAGDKVIVSSKGFASLELTVR